MNYELNKNNLKFKIQNLKLKYPQPLKFINLREHNICFYDEGKNCGQEKPTLIFIHGLAGCMDNWIPNLSYFSPKFRTVALDLPGFGLSEKKDFNYTINFFAETVFELLEKLKIKKPVLIGNSMGGQIVLNFALNYPQTPAGLVLVDPSGVQKFSPLLKLLAKMLSQINIYNLPLSQVVLKRLILRLFYSENSYVHLLYENALQRSQDEDFPFLVRTTLRCIHSLVADTPLEKIQNIKTPTLILWGENDKATPVSGAYFCKNFIKNSQLVIFPECGHLPQLEKEEEFNKQVETFINSLGIKNSNFNF